MKASVIMPFSSTAISTMTSLVFMSPEYVFGNDALAIWRMCGRSFLPDVELVVVQPLANRIRGRRSILIFMIFLPKRRVQTRRSERSAGRSCIGRLDMLKVFCPKNDQDRNTYKIPNST